MPVSTFHSPSAIQADRDEHEGEHHQQQDDAREQHQNTEQPADLAREGDVPEAERRHDDERPVEAGDPRMLFALDVDLDDVEDDGVERDEADDRQEVLQQRAKIRARLAVPHQVRELAAGDLHDS